MGMYDEYEKTGIPNSHTVMSMAKYIKLVECVDAKRANKDYSIDADDLKKMIELV